ncbi:MAG: SusD/RagB family nutrient-binding outer membrane lipoprotein [Niabella sp.]
MQKNYILIVYLFFALSFTSSCKKFLDINDNPNSSTTASPDLVFPQAIVYTGSVVNTYNSYGVQVGGYGANAGGYGGFGVNWTYDFGTDSYNGLWNASYDVLEDLQYVISSTEGNTSYAYYNAAAKILKVFNFQLLVDQYNDIPYSDALSSTNITPVYDNAEDIYVDLARVLDTAIATIQDAEYATALSSSVDPLFAGDMDSWIKFANTIKLRLIVRASDFVTFDNTTFTSEGFLTDDAVENPGYAQSSGQTNPKWSTWVVDYTGSAANRSWLPSKYVFGYYNGQKLTDAYRGAVIFYNFSSTPVNQLGNTEDVSSAPATAGPWYSGSGSGTSLGEATGVMKGYDMGMPLLTAAESYFLQAEAQVRGIISGDASTAFTNGIIASFHYLYELPDGTVSSDYDYEADAASYIAANSTSYLADFSLATTTDEQIEAIITQKYIALNQINSYEGWNDYRRTGYPLSSSTVANNPYGSMASTQSLSTRSDKLPSRILYPASEYSYNGSNAPSGISPFTSLIFWAQ